VPPLVDIITQNPGQSSEEIERYITIPIEVQMAGIPHVQAIRTISLFGLSDVKVQFTYDVTYQQASQFVINRLSPAADDAQQRPAGAVADQPDRRDLPLPHRRPARLHRRPTSRPSRTGSCSAASRRCPA
jgi:multidrug efflux pump subunit AcrB